MPPHSPGHIAWLATPGASKSPATPRRKLASLGFGAAADAERRQLLDLEDGKLDLDRAAPSTSVVLLHDVELPPWYARRGVPARGRGRRWGGK